MNTLMVEPPTIYESALISACEDLTWQCYETAKDAGWWDTDPIEDINVVPKKLMLIVSEISEAMEGHRTDAVDEKLPHRRAIEVELADAVHRIFDLAGRYELDIGGALVEKRRYNATRIDHTRAVRAQPGGKRY